MARPCVTSSDICKLIDALKSHPVGGLLATTVNETLKIVTSDQNVEKTVNREHYRVAQTPQMFRYKILYDAISRMLDNQEIPTDESTAIENTGRKVCVVEGRQDNIKITRREDLMIAEAILLNQEKH
jgi:2-C-methyl-D-erythritol 4-phosphate cytidylyltransferase